MSLALFGERLPGIAACSSHPCQVLSNLTVSLMNFGANRESRSSWSPFCYLRLPFAAQTPQLHRRFITRSYASACGVPCPTAPAIASSTGVRPASRAIPLSERESPLAVQVNNAAGMSQVPKLWWQLLVQ